MTRDAPADETGGRRRQRSMIISKSVARFPVALLFAAVACNDSTPPRNNEVPFEDLELGLELAAEGLNQAIFLTAPEGDARLFVVEKEGRVRVVKGGTLLPTPFLDISSRVGTVYSRGLL